MLASVQHAHFSTAPPPFTLHGIMDRSAELFDTNVELPAEHYSVRTKLSSACNFKSKMASLTCFSKSRSLFLGTSRAGNRSPISPMNTGMSSVTILGMLKSLRARISTWSSARPGSPLFREPATTRTDLMALRPQS
ncbi:hypothetical protein EYF80_008044 [Liparis tanakae]|uniref:Uncharacterized protein n=1 Tax=Liparis tanakae TaxID=230148 RepID=A0A4Z2IVR1_9TELE|nr:hypothetical protein EYF80_008044 [Liparis tanakae]